MLIDSAKLKAYDTVQLADIVVKADKLATRQRRIAVTLLAVAVLFVVAAIWSPYHLQCALTAPLVFLLTVGRIAKTVIFSVAASNCRQELAARAGGSDA